MVDYKSLVGRQWEYGKYDCYSIIRDYFALLKIDLPDYKRPESFATCKSIFLNNANKLNFKEIDINNRKLNDVLIMKIWTKEPMHGAIVLEDDMILHQKYESQSCSEYFNS